MTLLYLGGENFNLFSFGTRSVSPAAVSGTTANLGDGDPTSPHVAGSIAADSHMQVEYNGLTNPGFETASLVGWTVANVGTGTSIETTTGGEVRSGSRALKLTGSDASNYGSRYQDITVRAGDRRRVIVAAKQISGSGGVNLYIQNRRTGKYWVHASQSWVASRTAAFNFTSASYTPEFIDYEVESFEACRSNLVTLRWELVQNAGGTYVVDDLMDVPGVNFASVHGHNYGPVTPYVQYLDYDTLGWVTADTMTISRPAFYKIFAMKYALGWRIQLAGTNHEVPYTGEAVVGQYRTCATGPMAPLSTREEIPGVRAVTTGGKHIVYAFGADPIRDLRLLFKPTSVAAAKELVNDLWLRSGQGLHPFVIVPVDTEPAVYFGHFLEPIGLDRELINLATCEMPFAGAGFPLFA